MSSDNGIEQGNTSFTNERLIIVLKAWSVFIMAKSTSVSYQSAQLETRTDRQRSRSTIGPPNSNLLCAAKSQKQSAGAHARCTKVNMAHTTLTHETELRHLPLFQKRELAEILEVQDAWKFLMSAITEEVDGEIKFKYSPRHITIIEREAKAKPELRAAEILFEEWGTSGKKRPTLQNLMDTLAQLQLYRAADYVSMNILGGVPVNRLEVNLPNDLQDVMHDYENAETLLIEAEPVQPERELVTITYAELEDLCGWNYREQGKEQCIGVGAFACVFKASIPAINNGEFVAVKRFHSGNLNAPRQFEKELSALRDLNHKNIVRMLGLCEGEHKCLVLELMENGNLEDSLACKNRSTPLNWKTRIKIALDAAEGLKYLHSSRLIHRDIKSANILLDADCNAKLADFGLMQEELRPAAHSAEREEDSDEEEESSRNEIAGTSCYMSPEALLYGKVSMKGDIFSFGVVLLELLTSLPADDDNRTIRSLLIYVDEMCGENSIAPLLDTKAGLWGGQGQPVAHKLYNICVHCTNRQEEQRPSILSVVERLQNISRA